MPVFYYKSTCSTCRKAKALLKDLGVSFEERDMCREPLTEAELRALVGDRDITPFLNTRNEQYREQKMKANPPSRDEAFRFMATNANLVRRPLLVDGPEISFGFDEAEYRRKAGEA